MNFFDKHFDIDNLIPTDDSESGFMVKQVVWDKIYKKEMEDIKDELKNNPAILNNLNNKLFNIRKSK